MTNSGLIAAMGPLATLIPPSVSIVFYGSVTSESISRLLIAGFIPGILLILKGIITYKHKFVNQIGSPKIISYS